MEYEFTVSRPRPGVMTWSLTWKGRTFQGVVERPRCKVERLMLDCIRDAELAIEGSCDEPTDGTHEAFAFRSWICETNFAWVFSFDWPVKRGTAPLLGESRSAVERFKF